MNLLCKRINEAIDDWQQRTARKFNNTEFARVCHVTKQTVGDWRNDRTKTISGEALLNASDYLEVEPRWLCSGVGPKTKVIGTDLLNPQAVDFAVQAIEECITEKTRKLKGPEWLAMVFSKFYQAYFDKKLRELDAQTILKLVA